MWERALKMLAPYETVLFDLDGTLVVLEVDWPRVRQEMEDFAAGSLGRDFRGMTVWQMLRATEGEERRGLEEILERREVEGALKARKQPLADLLPFLSSFKVGVVSLNSRVSCLTALERAGLTPYVAAIVGREDTEKPKPDPEPLLLCLRALGSTPGGSVFIGDRERDRLTARHAGTAFIGSTEFCG